MSPFDFTVWSLILAVGFVISVENHLMHVIRKCMEMTKIEDSYSNSSFTVCGILLQQGIFNSRMFVSITRIKISIRFIEKGYSTNPLQFSSRVLLTTVLIFSLIIYQFYCSFIVGALLMEPPKTIKTVEQLYNSKLEVAIDDIAYVQDIFKYVNEEWTAKLYNRVMTQSKPIVPLSKGLNMVKKGLFVLNTDANYAYKLLQRMSTA